MQDDLILQAFARADNAARARAAFHPRRKKFKGRLRAKYVKNK